MLALVTFLLATQSLFGSVPLVTFPVSLSSSTIRAAATDAAGNIYVTGSTFYDSSASGTKNQFPATPGALQSSWGSKNCVPPAILQGFACLDAFVAKFSPAGELIYATYLGGSGDDEGMAIAVDASGNAWVAGYTTSTDFPITANALQKKNAGGTLFVSPTSLPPFQGDAFIAAVNPAGAALVYSSFLGGTGADVANLIAIDTQGNIVLGGTTYSTDFPVSTMAAPPAFESTGFVVRFNPGGPTIVYSTYFETNIAALAVNSNGSVYLAGTSSPTQPVKTTPGAFQTSSESDFESFVAKLSPDGASRIYATLLGGTMGATALTVDESDTAWIVGNIASAAFPATMPPAAQRGDVFGARLSADGSTLLMAFDTGAQLLVSGQPLLQDSTGNLYISGTTLNVASMTLTTDAFERSACGLLKPAIMKWSHEGQLLYSSFFQEGLLMTIDATGRLILGKGRRVITSFDPAADQRQGSLGCVTNGASFSPDNGYVSPGEIISLWGDRLGPDQPAQFELDASGTVSTNIGNTRVLFNSVAAPILYADAQQINVIVPWGIAPLQNLSLTVEHAGVNSLPMTIYDNNSTPGIFQVNSSQPASQGAILNEDGSVNSSSNPAAPGSIVSIFCTGMGLLGPVPQDGVLIQDATHLLQTRVPVLLPGPNGPAEAEIIYEGAAPTLVAGVIQVNVRLPDSFPASVTLPGPVPIYMHIPNGPITPPLATVAVQ